MAQVYTTDHSTSVLRTHSWRTVTNSAPHLLPHLTPNLKVLDVGCGPGSITISIAKQVPNGHVTGVEYVPDPLEGARELAKAEGVSNVTFQEGNIHDLPFADNTFDVVHAHQVLQHISDPVLALQEMRRVVKKGGIVACRESAELRWYPESIGIGLWREVTEHMQRARGGTPHPGRMIHVWAREAGFWNSSIKKSAGAWCFASDEERAYWGGSMEERARSSGFARSAVQDGFAKAEDLDIIAKAWREFVKNEDAWFGLLHGEILCWK
jgi:ubiquinone/menaquinone biosynthesis C-methylase UbiE